MPGSTSRTEQHGGWDAGHDDELRQDVRNASRSTATRGDDNDDWTLHHENKRHAYNLYGGITMTMDFLKCTRSSIRPFVDVTRLLHARNTVAG